MKASSPSCNKGLRVLPSHHGFHKCHAHQSKHELLTDEVEIIEANLSTFEYAIQMGDTLIVIPATDTSTDDSTDSTTWLSHKDNLEPSNPGLSSYDPSSDKQSVPQKWLTLLLTL